ncbi:MAG: ABC transporter permease [Bacteroidota bacterium]|nr:ABC transporter permease [Bacteroidota bacterium]
MNFTTEIKPKNKWYDIDFKAIWQYRDLMFLFVRRDFVSVYKQTVLGPIWFFIQPLLTTATFTLIFSVVAKISTNEIPAPLFYIIGLTFWGYFSTCLTSTSSTFVTNAGVFGKVYFPRLIMPISIVISSLIKLSIQFLLLLMVWLYYYLTTDILHPNITILLMPFYILLFAGLGLGFGIILSSLTTKYRDFTFLIGFGVQLLMYATPIIYPLSLLDDQSYIIKSVVKYNPISGIIEAIRYGLTGSGVFDLGLLAYSFVFVIILLFLGIITFTKVEKSFIDTV